jgi:hypothetical protein
MAMRTSHAPWDTAVYTATRESGMNAPIRDKVNLREKLELFTERWSPRIVGELNGQHVKIAKKGDRVLFKSRNATALSRTHR